MAILFYLREEVPYGCFSNFSLHPVLIYNRVWKTSEHPFQAMKFHPHRPDLVDGTANAPTPGQAANLWGRNRSYPMRKDWDEAPEGISPVQVQDGINRSGLEPEPLFARVKDVVMYEIVKAKFTQHEDLKQILLGTGNEIIIEAAEPDPYWGWGVSRNGQNKLGRILMLVRDEIRA